MSKTGIKKERRKRLTGEEIASYRKEWGVPDWHNAEAYPRKESDLTLDQWKWEFLRRSPDYRSQWSSKKRYRIPLGFDLKNWIDPRGPAKPKFLRDGCHIVEFDAKDGWPQKLHYEALKLSGREGVRIFSVDMNYALAPQLQYISEVYAAYRRSYTENPARKNVQRERAALLRVMDAYNEGVSISDILDTIYPRTTMSLKSMDKTIAFAKIFWKRL
jgi:hypothetical protein